MTKEALLIVDMQNDVLCRFVESGKEIIPHIQQILNIFRSKKKTIIHIVRVHRPDGSDVEKFRQKLFKEHPFLVRGSKGAEIIEELKPRDGEYIVEKQRFSGFFQTELQLLLNRLSIDTLVITGVQTPNCIRATVVDAISYDFDVILLKDAIAASDASVHESNLADMAKMGVKVMLTAEYLRGEFK